MTPLKTLEDLVAAGALGMTEYVITHPQRQLDVRSRLIAKFGQQRMKANKTTINALIRRAEASVYAAAQFSLTGQVSPSSIPRTPGLPGAGRYTFNSLVTVHQTDSNGQRTGVKETIFLTTSTDEFFDYKTLRRRLLQKVSAYCIAAGRNRNYEAFCSVRAGTDKPEYEILTTGIYRR